MNEFLPVEDIHLTVEPFLETKEIEIFLPNFEERKFIKEAIDDKIRALKAKEFFKISEKIRRGLIKNGYSPEQLVKDL